MIERLRNDNSRTFPMTLHKVQPKLSMTCSSAYDGPELCRRSTTVGENVCVTRHSMLKRIDGA
ncbi:hypothetical protein M407DRAFT_149900 [Tulasnella calospora MUT 4182]|uniref:Uncharacterized protein n=1 Tax=Tulasnella calospora MUT 4182 TaxID=1051891 RepID=A0A0C3Q6Z1_9AGAM|nr:hypothetical protein M407DRAFT_149900 [Tulasnella calospora MUT 4182]